MIIVVVIIIIIIIVVVVVVVFINNKKYRVNIVDAMLVSLKHTMQQISKPYVRRIRRLLNAQSEWDVNQSL